MTLNCRSCGAGLRLSFCDLGATPFSNSFLRATDVDSSETFYPLHARVCEACWLVQIPAFEPPERIFNAGYAYFSSYSDSWLRHAKRFCAGMTRQLRLDESSTVVEVASNDGYLLQYFQRVGIRVLGIEPSANCAEVAESRGIPTRVQFFGADTASALAGEGIRADLIVANNVLAHVPDINDFVTGFRRLLAPDGTVSIEFPHLLRLIEGNQFDTIYHEHFSYLSLLAVRSLLERHGLVVHDVAEIETHGGSLRVLAKHAGAGASSGSAVLKVIEDERRAQLDRPDAYLSFQQRVIDTRMALVDFLHRARREHKRVWGYGAPAKGNTLLNYCGVRSDLIEATVDRSPYKQGTWLPGVRIPVRSPEELIAARPDFVLILPWNLRDEIVAGMSVVRTWGGRFVIPIPEPRVLP